MKIIRNEKSTAFTFVPTNKKEERILSDIASTVKENDKLEYGGRADDGDCGTFVTVTLHAGGKKERVTKDLGGGSTYTSDEYVGSVKLVLRGRTKADKYRVNGIRNTCFFGSDGLIYLGKTEVDGKTSIIATASRCKVCDEGMLDHHACEWKTCDSCAKKCDHKYERGAIHSSTLDLGVGEYCTKCGRCPPKEEGEREKTQIEQHLAVEDELGITMIYKNVTPSRPKDLVNAKRLVRRHAKANRKKTV